jgi:alkylated DNA repair dioxygenase AlkB
MAGLFHIPPVLPSGFHYYPDFISEAEEQELVSIIRKYPLKNLIFQGFEAKRKVMSLGYDYHFDSRTITKSQAVPAALQPLLQKTGTKLGIPPEAFAEVLLTEYAAGTVINWHRDAPPFDKIAGISLLADCTFKLRPYDKSKQTRSAVRSFIAERRSLYLMEGEARSEWEHSISPVKEMRYSITLRTLRDLSPFPSPSERGADRQ